jgi:hypothetical protein
MAHTKNIKDIRARLHKVEKAKTPQDKFSELVVVKALVEEDLERLKRKIDKKEAAFNKRTEVIKHALKSFLTALDKIFAKHEELGDTQVREEMFAAIIKGFIKPERTYKLPAKFGMFSEQANFLVRAAIQGFLDHPEVKAAKKALTSPDERLNAFQDFTVETKEGINVFEYFGVRNKAVV